MTIDETIEKIGQHIEKCKEKEARNRVDAITHGDGGGAEFYGKWADDYAAEILECKRKIKELSALQETLAA